MRQITRHIGQQHVVSHVGGNYQAAPVFGGNLFKRDFRAILQTFAVALFQFIDMLLERRSLFQRMAQVKPDNP